MDRNPHFDLQLLRVGRKRFSWICLFQTHTTSISVSKATFFVSVIILKDTRTMSVFPSFCKKIYTPYRLPEMPTYQQKIIGSTKYNYRISQKLSQLAWHNSI